MNFSNRLKQTRTATTPLLSQAKIAEMIGMTQQSYQKIEKGGETCLRNIEKLAHILNVSPEWLAFGIGNSPFDKNSIPKGCAPILKWNMVHQWVTNKNKQNIDLLEYIKIPALSPLHLSSFSKRAFSLRVKGDAMVGNNHSFAQGTILIIEPSSETINNSYVIAIEKFAKEPIFRKYTEEGGKGQLVPLKSSYPVRDIDNYTVLGIVIAAINVFN